MDDEPAGWQAPPWFGVHQLSPLIGCIKSLCHLSRWKVRLEAPMHRFTEQRDIKGEPKDRSFWQQVCSSGEGARLWFSRSRVSSPGSMGSKTRVSRRVYSTTTAITLSIELISKTIGITEVAPVFFSPLVHRFLYTCMIKNNFSRKRVRNRVGVAPIARARSKYATLFKEFQCRRSRESHAPV